MIRDDKNDLVYLTQAEKYKAVINEIKDYKNKGNPILVGTASLESSELLSSLLKKENIEHQVLNAKNHAKEAEIISQAGKPGVIGKQSLKNIRMIRKKKNWNLNGKI